MTHSTLSFRLVLAALVLFTAACTSQNTDSRGETGAASQETLRIVFVTHGQASDPFWSVVQNGAQQAARDVGARVEYQAPESFDMVVMAQLVDAAVASNPDGLVVSIPDPDALSPSLRAAVQAGIPVISINSGNDVAAALGVLTHVGQAEYEAGYGGGERMAEAGIQNALCVNHEVGNAALDLRCQGFADAMRDAGARADVLAVELGDPTESQQRIQARLSSDSSVEAMVTLGPTSALPALNALRETGALGRITLATFDVTPEILQAIADGDMLFAIDQQPYLQGYLPVVLLSLHLRNAHTFPDDVTPTGPGFVTAENVERLQALTQKGTR